MKKLTIALALLISTNCFGSDYLEPKKPHTHPQVVHNYQNHKPPRRVVQRPHHGQPFVVYVGSTVMIQDHYDVYQAKVVYEKIDQFSIINHN